MKRLLLMLPLLAGCESKTQIWCLEKGEDNTRICSFSKDICGTGPDCQPYDGNVRVFVMDPISWEIPD